MPNYHICASDLVVVAIQVTEIAGPSQRDHIHNQNPVLERNEREVDGLDKGPYHPILRQSTPVCLVQPVLGARALHRRHTAQEDEETDRREDCLIGSHSGHELDFLVAVDDLVREELEPSCGSRTKDS